MSNLCLYFHSLPGSPPPTPYIASDIYRNLHGCFFNYLCISVHYTHTPLFSFSTFDCMHNILHATRELSVSCNIFCSTCYLLKLCLRTSRLCQMLLLPCFCSPPYLVQPELGGDFGIFGIKDVGDSLTNSHHTRSSC